MRNCITLLLAVIIIASCATAPTQQELSSADYGRAILQRECEEVVKNSMRLYLKDPESARYEFGACQRGYIQDPPIQGGGATFGYFVPVLINAKNSFGDILEQNLTIF